MILRRSWAFLTKDDVIKQQAKKRKEIVYGSQSVALQLGPFARPPGDWDLLSSNPLQSARLIEKKLDKRAGGDYYYTKASDYHKGTYKVREVGLDNKRGTEDDEPVADYTRPSRRYQTKNVGGLRVVALGETVQDKLRSVQDKTFAYRREKDSEDLNRIKFFKKLKLRG